MNYSKMGKYFNFKLLLTDKKFRKARLWSNKELKKFSNLVKGNIINVSGWKDSDKDSSTYKQYFKNVTKYYISNYISEARGFQGDMENEFFLDLTKPLPKKYFKKFEVVFNHTVLEHIYEVKLAFSNLCNMSSDIVIVVVPFLQEQHADYGDYWRFTPLTVKKLFEENGFETIYINYNDESDSSIYIFVIGTRNPESWSKIKEDIDNKLEKKEFIGKKIITNNIVYNLMALWNSLRSRFK